MCFNFSFNVRVIKSKCLWGNPSMVRIGGVSSYPVFELSGSNCAENSTPKPKETEIWFELARVPVIRDSSCRRYTVYL